MSYLKFEDTICGPMTTEFRKLPAGPLKEKARNEVLRMRLLCRDLWIEAGNKVPEGIRFKEPK